MSDQQNQNLNLKFCEYCMNIMDVYSSNDELHFVCSIPCQQSKTQQDQELELETDGPILLSKRLIDNYDTKDTEKYRKCKYNL